VLLAVSGAAAGLAHGIREHDVAHQVARLTASTLLQWPAVAVVGAVTLLLHGVFPRFATAAWGVLAACFLLGELGPLLGLGDRVMDLSPFSHLPALPGGEVESLPLVVLCLVAGVIAGIGLAAFRRRDLIA
jgi:ABC-2 type transport system permease protein